MSQIFILSIMNESCHTHTRIFNGETLCNRTCQMLSLGTSPMPRMPILRVFNHYYSFHICLLWNQSSVSDARARKSTLCLARLYNEKNLIFTNKKHFFLFSRIRFFDFWNQTHASHVELSLWMFFSLCVCVMKCVGCFRPWNQSRASHADPVFWYLFIDSSIRFFFLV